MRNSSSPSPPVPTPDQTGSTLKNGAELNESEKDKRTFLPWLGRSDPSQNKFEHEFPSLLDHWYVF